jgi:hypothetical protein
MAITDLPLSPCSMLRTRMHWHQERQRVLAESEGDPMIKGKIRQLRMARMRKRMIAQVPKASVVIMNPDPLRGRAAIRPRHECADLSRQGPQRDRAQDQEGRGRT